MTAGGWASPTDSTAIVADLTVRRVSVPLPRPWGPDVPTLTFLETRVVDTDGAEGVGFSWTPSIGAASVQAMIEHDIRDRVMGGGVDPTIVWQPLWEHLHEAGGGGVTTIAMAGLDLALWDLAARRREVSVAAVVRRDGAAVVGESPPAQLPSTAYGSGVNLHYGLDALVAQAESWVERGYRAIKIKVGSPDLARDVERVAAVRDVIGDRTLMIDANQRWDLDRATEAIPLLDEYGVAWVEEPLRADDLAGYVELSRRVEPALACGENIHHRYRFAEFAHSGAVGTLQPNIVRIGGITPLARIDADCAAAGVDVALHLLPELSAQIAPRLSKPKEVEVVDGAELQDLDVLADPSPVSVADGRIVVRDHVGIGIRFT